MNFRHRWPTLGKSTICSPAEKSVFDTQWFQNLPCKYNSLWIRWCGRGKQTRNHFTLLWNKHQ